MKKLVLFAIYIAAFMVACSNKGKTDETAGNDSLQTDSVEELLPDTAPKPMFVYAIDHESIQMVYWTSVKEPKKTQENADYFDEMYQKWEIQNGFRQNAAKYTKMYADKGLIDIKYTGELLKDPDGKEMYPGELHGRKSIPSPGLRYALVNAKDKNAVKDGMYVVCAESYLLTHKLLAMKPVGGNKPLPAQVVKQLENEYKMKCQRSQMECKDDRYCYGVLQFKGAYKTVKEYGETRQKALALEVLIDGDKVYSYPVEGHYDAQYGPTWNVDDDGEYISSDITAFEGPNGIEIMFSHGAPESMTVGRMSIVNGKLERTIFDVYHSMYDEEEPLWKKDIAKMQQLYFEADPLQHKGYKLTKYRYIFIDDEEEIWMRDKDDLHGAFFTRSNGNFQLIGTENEKLHPTFYQSRDGIGYLKISGAAGGPSYYTQIFEVSKNRVIHRFTALEVYGEINTCTMDGKPFSNEEGRKYMNALPPVQDLVIYWREIEN